MSTLEKVSKNLVLMMREGLSLCMCRPEHLQPLLHGAPFSRCDGVRQEGIGVQQRGLPPPLAGAEGRIPVVLSCGWGEG